MQFLNHQKICFISCIIIVVISAISETLAQSTLSPQRDDDCCGNVFLSSRGEIAQNQGPLLGKYKLQGRDKAKNPYYTKQIGPMTYYFFYKTNGTYGHGTNGWTVASSNDGSTYNIVSRNSNAACPEGISGAYDRDEILDYTFNVECNSDDEKSRIECCPRIVLNVTDEASSPIAKNNPAYLGLYEFKDYFNGRPRYEKQMGSFYSQVYFRKQGLISDGWAVSHGNVPGDDLGISISTRNMIHCPNDISVAYDQDETLDSSFYIICDVIIPLEAEKENLTTTTPNNEDRNPKQNFNHRESRQQSLSNFDGNSASSYSTILSSFILTFILLQFLL